MEASSHISETTDGNYRISASAGDTIERNPAGLKSQRFLITGGTHGPGLETARVGLSHGAWVIIAGRAQSALQRAAMDFSATSKSVAAMVALPRDHDELSTDIAATAPRLEGLDIVVHCDGSLGPEIHSDFSEEEARSAVMEQVKVPLLLADEALPYLKQRFEALLVSVDTTHAFTPTVFEPSHEIASAEYATSAFDWTTRLKKQGVRCLTFYPGDLTSFLGPANAIAMSLLFDVAHVVTQYAAAFAG